jgi:hypothetical protein
MRYDFGTAVTLTEITLGLFQGDSDITVLAHTGAGTGDLTGLTFSTSSQTLTNVANGWELIGNFDVDNTDASAPHVQPISTTVKSSQWLIAAYNPVFPGCSSGSCNFSSTSKDYVKVLGFGGAATTVPEPGTLALMALGLVPLARRLDIRRRGLARALSTQQ